MKWLARRSTFVQMAWNWATIMLMLTYQVAPAPAQPPSIQARCGCTQSTTPRSLWLGTASCGCLGGYHCETARGEAGTCCLQSPWTWRRVESKSVSRRSLQGAVRTWERKLILNVAACSSIFFFLPVNMFFGQCFLTRIELRTEDVILCSECKAHWLRFVILGWINETDLTRNVPLSEEQTCSLKHDEFQRMMELWLTPNLW